MDSMLFLPLESTMPQAHLQSTLALVLPPPVGSTPVLRLQAVGLGDASLRFSAHAGEILHLQGGTPALRRRLLALAAGHVQGGSGKCELLGHALHELSERASDRALRCLRERHIGPVLAGDGLPAVPTVLDCVAQPLLQQGVPARDALSRAALELGALGASPLALPFRLPASADAASAALQTVQAAAAQLLQGAAPDLVTALATRVRGTDPAPRER